MSNPEERKMDTEEEINENSDDSDYLWSDEEGGIRELVCGLPALRLSESLDVDETTRNQAAIAARLIIAAAEEAKEKTDLTLMSGSDAATPKTKVGRPRVLIEAEAASSGSTSEGGLVKKPRKKGSSQLTHPPQGPPKCNVCGKEFLSWKAVFGHLRSHKDRGYLGFLPPPTFNAAEEGFGGTLAASSGGSGGVPPLSSGTVAASSSGGGGSGLGTGGLGIDLNAAPMEEEEGAGSRSTPKFDLNRSPPQDEEEGKEDKAE